MKKMFVSALMLMAMSVAFVACDSISDGCKCTATYADGSKETDTVTKAEIDKSGYDVKTCKAYAKELKKDYDKAIAGYEDYIDKDEKITSISCKAK